MVNILFYFSQEMANERALDLNLKEDEISDIMECGKNFC